jgi:lipopolysaccharide/colanic/teichoic acid biosynthesis glycosyltransferase
LQYFLPTIASVPEGVPTTPDIGGDKAEHMHPSVHQSQPAAIGERSLPRLRALPGGRSLLVIGAGSALRSLLDDASSRGEAVLGVLAADEAAVPRTVPYLGPIDRIQAMLDSEDIEQVAICLEPAEWGRLEGIVHACLKARVPFSMPAIGTARPGAGQMAMKRTLDVIGASIGLLVLSPLLAAAAAAIRVSDGRPILFHQPRAGIGGRPFPVLKFRTMSRDADARRSELREHNEIGGAAFKMRNDPRVTPLGSWLRRMSIDELPQLWNVLKGEMSLVGPRPHPYDDVAGYRPWHLRRLTTKPGLTGLWQIELRDDPDFDRWVEKDLEYIDRWSIWLDLKIILRTIPAVLRGSGR